MVLAGEAAWAQGAQRAQSGFEARDFFLERLNTAVSFHI
jgi:hypothetical protein